jgi:hypothetical protein
MSSIPVGAASLEVTFVARKDGYEDAGVASFIQRNPSICIGYIFLSAAQSLQTQLLPDISRFVLGNAETHCIMEAGRGCAAAKAQLQ